MPGQEEPIRELDVVALLEDVQDENLVRGHVGTVVEIDQERGLYLIEFADSRGATFAMPALRRSQIMRLVQEPLQRAS
jgi:hypothetical protein